MYKPTVFSSLTIDSKQTSIINNVIKHVYKNLEHQKFYNMMFADDDYFEMWVLANDKHEAALNFKAALTFRDNLRTYFTKNNLWVNFEQALIEKIDSNNQKSIEQSQLYTLLSNHPTSFNLVSENLNVLQTTYLAWVQHRNIFYSEVTDLANAGATHHEENVVSDWPIFRKS